MLQTPTPKTQWSEPHQHMASYCSGGWGCRLGVVAIQHLPTEEYNSQPGKSSQCKERHWVWKRSVWRAHGSNHETQKDRKEMSWDWKVFVDHSKDRLQYGPLSYRSESDLQTCGGTKVDISWCPESHWTSLHVRWGSTHQSGDSLPFVSHSTILLYYFAVPQPLSKSLHFQSSMVMVES